MKRKQRRALLRWAAKSGCLLTYRSCEAVAAVGRGASCRAAARWLECATSTVVAAVRRYREGGRHALRDKRAGNGRAIQLLWRLSNVHRRARRIHLALDNASVHSSKKTCLAAPNRQRSASPSLRRTDLRRVV
ncbi:helix-turn-helix domain-containing protein [Myxococcus faecalis]|uniref:helix-turn-helix domain-containing protein n=1 Tax=Myxococcus TaxID=32 RepID=UPI001CC04387|nr:helix-turn-helix domain-containing protein [Myxococcus sp. AS-1-15]